MKYEIKQLNATDAVVISDEEIKINDPITDGYRVWYWRDNCSLLGRKKIIATISPYKIEGLPMLELPNKTPIIDTFWLEKLCYYDSRNPDNCIDKSDLTEEELSKPQVAGEDYANILCSCDNCFYGRTKMAEKYISELPNQEEDFTLLNKVIEEESERAYIQTGSLTSIEIVKRAASAGYKAAQKQYSEEDIIKAIEMAREADSLDGTVDLHIVLSYPNTDNSDLRIKWTEEEIIQSLQKKQFPIAVELTEDLKVIKWHYEKES